MGAKNCTQSPEPLQPGQETILSIASIASTVIFLLVLAPLAYNFIVHICIHKRYKVVTALGFYIFA